MQDFNAKEAADVYLKPHVCFSDLKPGEVFRFPGMERPLVRVRGGYRYQTGSPIFKTGKKTAVITIV